MFEVLAYHKETERKLRWDATVEDTVFELYIPKWRVPEPMPLEIRVRVYLPEDTHPDYSLLPPRIAVEEPLRLLAPIVVRLQFFKEHTKAHRYDPIGDPKSWETGSPYIPKSLLPSAR